MYAPAAVKCRRVSCQLEFFVVFRIYVRPGNCIIDAIHELEEMEDVVMAGSEVMLPKVSQSTGQTEAHKYPGFGMPYLICAAAEGMPCLHANLKTTPTEFPPRHGVWYDLLRGMGAL